MRVGDSSHAEEAAVQASVGDRIIVRGHRAGEPDRDAEIMAVGADGGSPYTVRWSDTGHEALFYPGNDATIQHFEHGKRVVGR